MNIVNQTPVPAYMLIRQYVMGIASRPENNGAKIMSIRGLCKLFNVSHPTVMKALQELITEGVLIAKPGMGTYVNSVSKTPFVKSLPQFKQIGLIVSTGKLVHYDQFYQKIISGIFDVLSENGGMVQLINPLELNADFANVIKAMHLNGVVWVNPTSECMPCLEAIDKTDIPLVMTTLHHPDFSSKHSVVADFYQAGYLVGQQLFETGHRKILHLCNDYSNYSNNNRTKSKYIINGLKAAYEERDLTLGDEYFLEGGEELIEKVDMMIKLGFKFSAVFTDGNFCLPIYELLQKNGIRIPEEVLLVTMEDAFSKQSKLGQTFVRCPLKEMGKKAAEHLMVLINNRNTESTKISLNWELCESDI